MGVWFLDMARATPSCAAGADIWLQMLPAAPHGTLCWQQRRAALLQCTASLSHTCALQDVQGHQQIQPICHPTEPWAGVQAQGLGNAGSCESRLACRHRAHACLSEPQVNNFAGALDLPLCTGDRDPPCNCNACQAHCVQDVTTNMHTLCIADTVQHR